LAAALVLLAGCAKPAPAGLATGAAAVVDSLYRTRQPFQGKGAPTATELASMRPWLSVELQTLLVRADSLRSAESAAAPDEKPSFAEGDLFTSLFEGPTRFEIKPAEVSSTGTTEGKDKGGVLGQSYAVPVHFSYSDDAAAQRWVDTILVITEAGHLVVSDVRYGGTWDFANKGSLVTSLDFSFVPGTAGAKQ
jgi:hypothetical protein